MDVGNVVESIFTQFSYSKWERIRLGLARIEKILTLLGNPEKDIPVVHIGGTNGKGSVSAMVSSILQSAGYRV